MTDKPALTVEDIERLKTLASGMHGFYTETKDFGIVDRTTLAQLETDGSWRNWDTNICLSQQACEWIVAAFAAMPQLLAIAEQHMKSEVSHAPD
jgi:hypothetical protein